MEMSTLKRLMHKDLGQIADAQYPPLEFILPDRQVMPCGAVTILSGQGSLGKSGIMLQLGSARSLKSQWLGEQVLPGRTLYFNYDDTVRVVGDRGRRIAEHYDCATGDLSEFEVVDRAADGDEWVRFLPPYGEMQTTKEYDRAVATIEASKADLVVIDGVSQVFGGNDIDKRQVRQFLQLLNRLAEKYNAAIVLIAHPSRSGSTERTGKSGSEQWFNGSRSFLHFERPPAGDDENEDRDARLLRVTKNNYGPDDLELRLRHLGYGLIVRDGDLLNR